MILAPDAPAIAVAVAAHGGSLSRVRARRRALLPAAARGRPACIRRRRSPPAPRIGAGRVDRRLRGDRRARAHRRGRAHRRRTWSIYPRWSSATASLAHAHVDGARARAHRRRRRPARGAVIGSDGFGYVPTGGRHPPPPAGAATSCIEDEVEVGANSTVDRAMVGSTMLRRGVKLDNLVMIAHGCEVGDAQHAGRAGRAVGEHADRPVGADGRAGRDRRTPHASATGPRSRPRAAWRTRSPPAPPSAAIRRSRWASGGAAVAATTRLPELLRRVRRLERRLGVEVRRPTLISARSLR